MKKISTGKQIGIIAVGLFGLIFLGSIFGKAFTKDRATQSMESFGDRSQQGLLKYLKESCDGGNQKSCQKYKQQGGQ